MLGVVNTGIGCLLYFSAVAKLPVQTVAVVGYLEPLSAVVFSAVLLGEVITPVRLMGAALIIGGAIFANSLASAQAPRPVSPRQYALKSPCFEMLPAYINNPQLGIIV